LIFDLNPMYEEIDILKSSCEESFSSIKELIRQHSEDIEVIKKQNI